MNVWCRFVLGVLWEAEVCSQPPSSLIGKVLALVTPFFVWHTPYRVLWRCGRRQNSLDRLQCCFSQGEPSGDSLQALFRGSWRFSALYSDSLSLSGHSMSWWMVVVANLLCFGPAVVPLVHCRAFLYSGKQAFRLCGRLHSGGCCAIPW